MQITFEHEPVLLDETVFGILPSKQLVEFVLSQRKPFVFVDATLGGAGHAIRFLDTFRKQSFFGPGVNLDFVGFDQDPLAMSVSTERIQLFLKSENLLSQIQFIPAEMNFENAPKFLFSRYGLKGVNGIYADFGVSSPQLDDGQRGFSLQRNGPLDMRMNPKQTTTALDIIMQETEENLSRIFFEFGEEPRARKLAKGLVSDRAAGKMRVSNTIEFAEYICAILSYPKSRANPATRIFQALRIAVNGELDAIETLLNGTPEMVSQCGKAAFISFHSLEDRLVKKRFRAWQDGKIKPDGGLRNYEMERYLEKTTWGKETPRGGQVPSEDDCRKNPRARSARLRIFEFAT